MLNLNLQENYQNNYERNEDLNKNEYNMNFFDTKSLFRKPRDFLENILEINEKKSNIEFNPYHRSFSQSKAKNDEGILSLNGNESNFKLAANNAIKASQLKNNQLSQENERLRIVKLI